ncbi:hypothetical protein VFMJ11_1496 [Aliivibrio fischeri MJ11]|uniref:Uncharacterized protein n=1 Tax=Aliivibrio fischeri (strain MJ11) TaxID=388396 RepID=B5FEF0_ALIFM|nr:hypothetical protein VFMJ11_1496 [Aliivibrio fischeri MJ11]
MYQFFGGFTLKPYNLLYFKRLTFGILIALLKLTREEHDYQ